MIREKANSSANQNEGGSVTRNVSVSTKKKKREDIRKKKYTDRHEPNRKALCNSKNYGQVQQWFGQGPVGRADENYRSTPHTVCLDAMVGRLGNKNVLRNESQALQLAVEYASNATERNVSVNEGVNKLKREVENKRLKK